MLTLYLTCLVGGGIFVALSVFSGIDSDADFDVDQGLDIDAEIAVEVEVHGASPASMADASHGLNDGQRRGANRLWLPFFSFRFWTFGAAFFGMTGSALTSLSQSGEPLTLGISSAVGVCVGSAAALLVRMLQKPVGQKRLRADDFTGASGELLLGLSEAGVSKVRVHGPGGVHELLALCDDGRSLAKGTRVVVLGLDAEGRARVTPEAEVFGLEET